MLRHLLRFLVIAVMTLSAAYLACQTWQLRKAYGSLLWPETMGMVLSYDIDFKQADMLRKVSYGYGVDRVSFHGDRIQFGSHGASLQEMMNRMSDDTAIDSIRVYYNPRHPSECTLLRGPSRKDFLLNLLPIPFLAIGFVLLLILHSYEGRE